MYQTALQFSEKMPDARVLMSDEPERSSSLHYFQLLLLVTSLEWHWRDRNNYFIGANLSIYFSRQQLKNRDFRGPDFFLVNGVSRHPRNSWVVWEEDGQYVDHILSIYRLINQIRPLKFVRLKCDRPIILNPRWKPQLNEFQKMRANPQTF